MEVERNRVSHEFFLAISIVNSSSLEGRHTEVKYAV